MKNQVLLKNLKPGNLKIVFFGTSEFAVPTLKYLIQNGYEVIAVVTQPEKPAGRLRVIMPSPVKKAAIEANIQVFEPHNLKKDEEFLKHLQALNFDLGIVVAYGKIIPSQYLEVPKYGFLNIHPSLLPKYRGPSPVQAAIMSGDSKTGITIMKVDEQMDHGSILAQTSYDIPNDKYFLDINNEIWEVGAKLLMETLPKWIVGSIKSAIQDENQVTFCKLLTREDGKINWNRTAEEIYNQVRALNPEPGAWTVWKGKVLNVKKAELSELKVENKEPGMLVNINNNVAVATQKCYLILKQIQLEGRKEMDAKAFLNGHPDFLSSKLE